MGVCFRTLEGGLLSYAPVFFLVFVVHISWYRCGVVGQMMAFWIPHEIPLKKCPQSILVNFTPGPSYTLGKLGPWRVFNFPLKGAKHGEIGGTQRVGLSVCFWGFFCHYCGSLC